jgi:hypothetical protein
LERQYITESALWPISSILMRRPSRFRKSELTRVTKAVLEAGLEIDSVEVASDGAIRVKPRKPSVDAASMKDDLDRELAEFNAQHD